MKLLSTIVTLGLLLTAPAIAQSEPPVKMSKTGICHAKGSTYYAQTKSFTPYKTPQECLSAGGRMLTR
jgi:hypothetical protein